MIFRFVSWLLIHPVYRICIPEFARLPIYMYICIFPVRLQVSGKLYDSDGEAFRRITFLGIDFTTPLYLYYRRFIRVETSYLRGYTWMRGGGKERGRLATRQMEWNGIIRGARRGVGEIVGEWLSPDECVVYAWNNRAFWNVNPGLFWILEGFGGFKVSGYGLTTSCAKRRYFL